MRSWVDSLGVAANIALGQRAGDALAASYNAPSDANTTALTRTFQELTLPQLRQLFEQKASRGPLGFADFSDLMGELLGADPNDSQLHALSEVLFEMFDRDKSNAVDWQEMETGLSLVATGSDFEKLEAVFELFDADRNGFLSRLELQKMLSAMSPSPINYRKVGQQLDEIMYYADANNDGQVSWAEFRTEPLRQVVMGWLDEMAKEINQRLASQRVDEPGSTTNGMSSKIAHNFGRKYGVYNGWKAQAVVKPVPDRYVRFS